MMHGMVNSRVRVAIANDYDIVVAGVAAALSPFSDRIEIVELTVGATPDATPGVEVDVVLYDTFGQPSGERIDLARLSPEVRARLLIFSWNIDADLVRETLELGATGYVAKTVSANDLADAIERVGRGESVTMTGGSGEDLGRWPGDEHGLSNREAEVLALISQGLSNREICEQTRLSNNTLKTYVRTLYSKIGAVRRSQAVLWAVEHGFSREQQHRRQEG